MQLCDNMTFPCRLTNQTTFPTHLYLSVNLMVDNTRVHVHVLSDKIYYTLYILLTLLRTPSIYERISL
jgi:hypothetical protein